MWSLEERKFHINHLKLLAGSFAVQAFTKDKRNIHVHLQMDDSTAHFYVSKVGGTRSSSLMHGSSLSPMAVVCEQSGGRQGVSISSDISRMETARESLSECVPEARTMSSGPIRITPEQPTGSLCELETRPVCFCNRCTSDQLGSSRGVCLSSICSDRSVSSEDQNREVYTTANSPVLEVPTLVSSSARTVGGFSNPPAPARESTKRPLRSATPSEIPAASRLESIRRQHASVGVSEQAAELLVAGWSKGTNTAYQSGWQQWYSWCCSREIDPIHCGVQPLLDFLTELFQSGL